MAQQVRLLNKIFILLMLIFLLSCGKRNVVPAVYVNAKEKFQTKQGVTYLNEIPFSGWQFALYENDDTAFVVPYYKGKENGISRSWYENKQLKEIRIFDNGKKIGEHKGWWPDGKQKFIYHFSNDIYEGNVKEWYQSGQLFKNFNYENGQESGMQIQYFNNGVLQFNYEARNGRDYGLTGVKNCENVKDSIGVER